MSDNWKSLAINDEFDSLEEVADALQAAGVDDCTLIFGIDYTSSNNTAGTNSFGGKSLHTIAKGKLNPYQQVIRILGDIFDDEEDDDDDLIFAYGFGDSKTKDKSVFPFAKNGCKSFQEILKCYNRITPSITKSGPTDFSPLIEEAIRLVKKDKRYHVLIIIADGQVSSQHFKKTRDAIVKASNYPLSIIMVGVGDGPWGDMVDFDDNLPQRKFDNFQFVDFYKTTKGKSPEKAEIAFALQALMEIPEQYEEIMDLEYLN